jgi:hypothetical protein
MFVNNAVELRGSAPAGPVLDRLLAGWQEIDEPIMGEVISMLVVSVLPLLLAAGLVVGHLLSKDIPWWAPLIPVGMAGAMFLAVGVKIVLSRLRRTRRSRGGKESEGDE